MCVSHVFVSYIGMWCALLSCMVRFYFLSCITFVFLSMFGGFVVCFRGRYHCVGLFHFVVLMLVCVLCFRDVSVICYCCSVILVIVC